MAVIRQGSLAERGPCHDHVVGALREREGHAWSAVCAAEVGLTTKEQLMNIRLTRIDVLVLGGVVIWAGVSQI
jgi:hypothetical protein